MTFIFSLSNLDIIEILELNRTKELAQERRENFLTGVLDDDYKFLVENWHNLLLFKHFKVNISVLLSGQFDMFVKF